MSVHLDDLQMMQYPSIHLSVPVLSAQTTCKIDYTGDQNENFKCIPNVPITKQVIAKFSELAVSNVDPLSKSHLMHTDESGSAGRSIM
jgi:hypothetical protein